VVTTDEAVTHDHEVPAYARLSYVQPPGSSRVLEGHEALATGVLEKRSGLWRTVQKMPIKELIHLPDVGQAENLGFAHCPAYVVFDTPVEVEDEEKGEWMVEELERFGCVEDVDYTPHTAVTDRLSAAQSAGVIRLKSVKAIDVGLKLGWVVWEKQWAGR